MRNYSLPTLTPLKVLFTRMQEAKQQNICPDAGQMCDCFQVNLIKLKLKSEALKNLKKDIREEI